MPHAPLPTQVQLDPEYRKLSRERQAAAAAKTRTVQYLQVRRAGLRRVINQVARSAFRSPRRAADGPSPQAKPQCAVHRLPPAGHQAGGRALHGAGAGALGPWAGQGSRRARLPAGAACRGRARGSHSCAWALQRPSHAPAARPAPALPPSCHPHHHRSGRSARRRARSGTAWRSARCRPSCSGAGGAHTEGSGLACPCALQQHRQDVCPPKDAWGRRHTCSPGPLLTCCPPAAGCLRSSRAGALRSCRRTRTSRRRTSKRCWRASRSRTRAGPTRTSGSSSGVRLGLVRAWADGGCCLGGRCGRGAAPACKAGVLSQPCCSCLHAECMHLLSSVRPLFSF